MVVAIDSTCPAPPAAAAIFGEQLPLAVRYADLLTGPGIVAGVIGPRETETIWDRHLLNCACVTALLPPGSDVIDVGSGAGLPGIPIVLAQPDVRMTLLEPLARRQRFLTMVRDELDLDVALMARRAEEYGDQTAAVVARAVAPLPELWRMVDSLVAPGGCLLALKGSRAADEVRGMPRDTRSTIHQLAVGTATATVVRVRRVHEMDS